MRKYGALRDVSDVRDQPFRAGTHVLPPLVDLRNWCGPVKDQGEEGSCTGHAYSSYREWIARKYEGKMPVLSPQFLYVQELIMEGSFPEDNGAQPRSGCRVLNQTGCCEEGLYPYVAGVFSAPSTAQLANAGLWRLGAYHRIQSLSDALSCLGYSEPWPITVGFTVYESFESQEVADTGIMPIPQRDEEVLGGHEVLCVGYDLLNKQALIQNSWGKGWGLAGYFWMPFEVLADPSTDLWMIHPGHWGK